jgi:hypothetical protein
MNTQFILISVIAFIAGIAVRSIFKKKPKYEPSNSGTETVKTETVKNISLSKIIEFITEKLSEDEEIEIVKAAKKNPEIAITITKMTKHLHDTHRGIKSRFK